MSKLRFTVQTLALVVLTIAFTSLAQAQTRTWVSGVGDDLNPCSRTAPCKTFAGAISKTTEGGEIDALDPGGFGTVTITKAITIDGTTGAGFGSILNSGTSGVNVNIATANVNHPNDAVVILRNLYIQGVKQSTSAAGTNGINYIRGAQLYVENCYIENQSTTGINANLTSSGNLFVFNTILDNVTTGINSTTTVGLVQMLVTNSQFRGNTNGIKAVQNSFGAVSDSNFSKNSGTVDGSFSAGTNCQFNLARNIFSNNEVAVKANTGSTIRVSLNHIYNNSNGLTLNGGTISSDGQNRIAGNSASAAPNGAAIVLQ